MGRDLPTTAMAVIQLTAVIRLMFAAIISHDHTMTNHPIMRRPPTFLKNSDNRCTEAPGVPRLGPARIHWIHSAHAG